MGDYIVGGNDKVLHSLFEDPKYAGQYSQRPRSVDTHNKKKLVHLHSETTSSSSQYLNMAPADAMNTESFSCLSVEKRPYPKPLKSSGALAKFTCEDMTPVIGREFPTVNIVEDILNAVNSNELIRDLAIDSAFFPAHGKTPESNTMSQFHDAV